MSLKKVGKVWSFRINADKEQSTGKQKKQFYRRSKNGTFQAGSVFILKCS